MLRRAMGKKKPEEMAKQREIFLKGAEEKEIPSEISGSVFDLMEKFAAYGFNKAHSAAYAVISYQTAWLKTHYPSEFLAASMSEDMDTTSRIVIYLNEAKTMDILVDPPNINECDYRFRAKDSGEIVYGLGAVKGVGQAVLEHLVEERDRNGEYRDLFDLCYRVDIKKVNRRALQALTKAGAFDAFGDHRASIYESIDLALEAASQRAKSKEAGQNELFAVEAPRDTVNELKQSEQWAENDLLAFEKENLGLYLSGHPVDVYIDELRKVAGTPLVDVSVEFGKKSMTLAGLVVDYRVQITKRGDKMAFITLDDKTARLELVMYHQQLEQFEEKIQLDEVLIVKATVSKNKFSQQLRVVADAVYDLHGLRADLSSRIDLSLNESVIDQSLISQLQTILAPQEGAQCVVSVKIETEEAHVDLVANHDWRIRPSVEVLTELDRLVGKQAYQLHYS